MNAKLNPWVDADRRLSDFMTRVSRRRLEPRWPCLRTWLALPLPLAWLLVAALLTSMLHLAYHWWRG